mmetsp:Transcript_16415/g.35491  ORF Transcript_16415/g.35491 Transcript_16415/m.35491 type:complete len:310 (+) Transcript_16415:17-946(+)
MSLSLKSLQAQVDDLTEHCPVLLPNIRPHGYAEADLLGLFQNEGKEQHSDVLELLSSHASRADSCCVCGASGQPCISSSIQEDEASTLRFSVFTRISFAEKTIKLSAGGFACGQCRALRDARRFLHLSAFKLDGQHPEREALIRGLCLHLAAVNKVDECIQANPEAVAVWSQEVLSRAYALQVVASNIHGWKLTGPDDAAIKATSKAAVMKLAQQLLALQEEKRRGRRSKAPTGKTPHSQRSRPSESAKPDKRGRTSGDDVAGSRHKSREVPPAKKVKAAPAADQGTAKVSAQQPAAGKARPAKSRAGK